MWLVPLPGGPETTVTGSDRARITTWVIGGISVCCSGLGLAGTALTNSMNLSDTSGGPSPQRD